MPSCRSSPRGSGVLYRSDSRSRRHGDDALPPLPLAGVIENRYRSGRLHNLKHKTGVTTKIRQHGGHTALAEVAVLRIVGTIDNATSTRWPSGGADRQVVRRNLRSSGW